MDFLLQKWKELREPFAHTPQAVRLVWQTQPRGHSRTWALLTLGGALLPASQAWVGKLIVDGVVAVGPGQQQVPQPDQLTVFVYLLIELDFLSCSAPRSITRAGSIQQLIQLQLANRIRR